MLNYTVRHRETWQPPEFEVVTFQPCMPELGRKSYSLIPGNRGSFCDYWEVMKDEPKYFGQEGWTYCEHYKRFCGQAVSAHGVWINNAWNGTRPDIHYGLEHSIYAAHDPNTVFGPAGKLNSGLPAMYVGDENSGYVPDPSQLDSLKNRAFSVMLPKIKAELSLINSIIELKDFKTLPATLKSMLSWKGLSFSHSASLREMARKGADAFLQWKFNIAPLISDVCGIHTALRSVEKRINDFISREGKLRTSHFGFNWNEFADSTDSTLTTVYNSSLVEWTREVNYSASTFHAEIQFNYNYTEYQREHARVLALLDAFGVNLNPTIIWNAIPWSFVVDWVIGVGQWLDQWKVGNMDPKINIVDSLWSIKRRRTITVTKLVHCDGLNRQSMNTRVALPVVTEEAYKRTTGIPIYKSLISSGLNSSEFSLAAALVVSRRRSSSKHPRK